MRRESKLGPGTYNIEITVRSIFKVQEDEMCTLDEAIDETISRGEVVDCTVDGH
jgi:hypothetical protein